MAPRATRSTACRARRSHRTTERVSNVAGLPLGRDAIRLGVECHPDVGHQLIAVAARFLARGLGREAAQEGEQRLDLADLRILAAGEHALDHAALEPAGAPP